ncbi:MULTISPECIES: hypothetical protein [Olivibacter]|uniref:Asl1-like glycosyl hydrolase catalytic domain-containing protein n=1 Tax=Olivibacter oleidegradans TaxID=760123 RepID=A0ABV6HQ06_9SPHI|nr:hypothetical protein [Olivibacter jilunii]
MVIKLFYLPLRFLAISMHLLAAIRCDGHHQSQTKVVFQDTTALIPSITVDRFMGVNAFVDDPPEDMLALGFIREYHSWVWDEGNGSTGYQGHPYRQIKVAPGYPGWNFDQFYGQLRQIGLQVSPCIQSSVPWLDSASWFPTNIKPTDQPNAAADQPSSYEARASYLFQFAGRYGSHPIPNQEQRFAADQPMVSGLGHIQYLEDWNEPDRFWEGAKSAFKPDEFAAMLSADYDGHEQSMVHYKTGKPSFGVKNADPTIKLVMGGLSSINLEYIDQMNQWFKQNRRDKKFAADVINVHTYAWKNGKDWQGGGPAISPEQAKFKEQAAALVAYRNEHLPNLEVWISEFGWDTHPGSVLSPPAIGKSDIREVQARWILRAYLAFAAAGVDRAQLYMLRDVNPNDPIQFSSSGLVSEKGVWEPKTSWYYVYTMKNVLTNMVFAGEERSTHPTILIYKFKHLSKNELVYVLWSGTSTGYQQNNYRLKIKSRARHATIIEPIVGKTRGKRIDQRIKNNRIELNVNEKPTFVLVK